MTRPALAALLLLLAVSAFARDCTDEDACLRAIVRYKVETGGPRGNLEHDPTKNMEQTYRANGWDPERLKAALEGRYVPRSDTGGEPSGPLEDNTLRRDKRGRRRADADKKAGEEDKEKAERARRGVIDAADDAADTARELIDAAKKSGDPTDYRDAGDAALKEGDPQQAAEQFSKSIERDPKDAKALVGRAQARLAQGDKPGAVEDAHRALALEPGNQIAQLIVGHGDTLSHAGQNLKTKPDFGALRSDGESGGAPGAGKTALGEFTPQVRTAPPSLAGSAARTASPAQTLLSQAEEKLRMRDFSGALLAARQAADLDPRNPKAWVMIAKISNENGNYKAAIAAAEEALKLDPQDAQALRAKAYAEYELGDYAQAREDARKAVELDPKSGLGYLYLAMSEEKLGDAASAIEHYEKALALDPTLAAAVEEALGRLKPGLSKAPSRTGSGRLLRGGSRMAALALIVLGLLGAAAGKHLTGRARRAESEGESPEAAPAVGAGSVIGGNYEITGELGRGGMGVVYGAFDRTLQRRVAIKQLSRDENTTSEDLTRLLKEARLVAQLRHPNLAEIYTVVDENDLYLVFELIDGQSLDKVLAMNKKLPVPQVRRLLGELCSALDYAHSQRIVHRDLKPGNVMLTVQGAVKVMDFGIAHQSQGGKNLTQTSASGTPPYMAPEQALGSVSKSSDLYALAVMTYEMLTGELPFEGPDFLEQKLRKTYRAASQRNPDLRRDVDAFFAAALDPDPTKRPADGKAFLRAFEAACAV